MNESVILAAQKRTLSKIEANKRKAQTRRLTLGNVLTVFNSAFKDAGYGEFPPLNTQKTAKMMLGMIKMAQKEYKRDAGDYIYGILKDFVAFFEEIKQKEAHTLNGKYWRLSAFPNIRDLVICREFVISAITEIKNKPEEDDYEPPPRSLF